MADAPTPAWLQKIAAWLWSDDARMMMAGGAGGFVTWLSIGERVVVRGVVRVLAGAIAAAYVGPWAVPLLEPTLGRIAPPGADVRLLGAFLVGSGGLVIGSLIADLWTLRFRRRQNGDAP